jgi:small GTP-binding protein
MSSRDYRIVIVGDTHTGKSSILHRFLHNDFTDEIVSTIGLVERSYQAQDAVFFITDTTGQEAYISMCSSIYNKADCFILTAAWDSRTSLDSISRFWIPRLQESVDLNTVPVVMAVNKCDLEEDECQLTREQFDEFSLKDLDASEPDQKWSVSAKYHINIAPLFEAARKASMQRQWGQSVKLDPKPANKEGESGGETAPKNERNRRCCG